MEIHILQKLQTPFNIKSQRTCFTASQYLSIPVPLLHSITASQHPSISASNRVKRPFNVLYLMVVLTANNTNNVKPRIPSPILLLYVIVRGTD